MDQKHKQLHDDLAKRFTDQGKLIEAGWVALRVLTLPLDAPEIQVVEMRKAFMCGAQHLFASVMAIMDPGAEPTEQDMRRMTMICNELEAFKMEVTAEHKPGHS